MKYVFCTHTMSVLCKYKDTDGEQVSITFNPFVLNKYTGQPITTGYTPVKEEVLEALQKQSNLFKSFLNQKLLTVVDKLPASAETPHALLQAKQAEINRLMAELAEAKAEIARGGITKEDVEIAKAEAVEEYRKANVKESSDESELSIEQSLQIAEQLERIERLEEYIIEKGLELPLDGESGAPVSF